MTHESDPSASKTHASPEITRCIQALKASDFELAYLAVLAREGLKPMSRWERPLAEHEVGWLRHMGLLVRQVRRPVKTGKQVVETIFSVSAGCLDLYEQRFADQPIDKAPDTVRLEGFLFGYPPCCVEQYVRRPYAPNDLPDDAQRILFHWACNACSITPLLLPRHKSVHQAVEDA